MAGHKVLHLSYEDLQTDIQASSDCVINFLGLQKQTFRTPATHHVKSSSDQLGDIFVNYEEFKKDMCPQSTSKKVSVCSTIPTSICDEILGNRRLGSADEYFNASCDIARH